MRTSLFPLSAVVSVLVLVGAVQAQQPGVAVRAAELKANIATSQAALRQYEWIQTTVVNYKGEEKSSKQERCYYGAEGGIEKIEIDESPEAKKKRGLRGRIAKHEKEELTQYMKNAVGLVKTYVPPSPGKIQAAKDAGKVSLDILDPGKRIRLGFKDYEKPGDVLSVEVDLTSNKPLGITVSTYLDEPADVVTLNVKMGQLLDGTSYPEHITVAATAKHLGVDITNSGYQKSNQPATAAGLAKR